VSPSLLQLLLLLLQAVRTWMGKMNLTMAELQERPGLVAAVVAYHGAWQCTAHQQQQQQQQAGHRSGGLRLDC
jgi:hypothetical protein